MLVDLDFLSDQYPWRDDVKLLKFDTSDGHLVTEIQYTFGDQVESYESLVAYRLQKGVYETDLNFDHSLGYYTKYTTDILDKLDAYGVADNIEQLLNHHSEIIDSPENFVVSVVPMKKSEQPAWGGWRWHKWGEYIGTQNPTQEYLYDELEIEEVLVYSIHHLVAKP